MLDRDNLAYLDYTGAALPPRSLVEHHARLLTTTPLGNPHSFNPASERSSRILAGARDAVRTFFSAEDAYEVIFTANATAAIRLIAESFPFGKNSELLLSSDNHNSVNGIREYARRGSARSRYLPLDRTLRFPFPVDAAPIGPSLFAYPAQSNFSGARHPLSYVTQAQNRGYRVLLDAAAYVPGARLNLNEITPDFVCVSFYKMFGYPTGVGALLVRKDALSTLRRPWFAGGTVDFASTQLSRHQLKAGPESFEDGTPPFSSLSAVIGGLRFLKRLGMDCIARHNAALFDELLGRLEDLRHSNGAPLLTIYGHPDDNWGSALAFNVLTRRQHIVPYSEVERSASTLGIALRGGCFCNPGCAEAALEFSASSADACLRQLRGHTFTPERFGRCMNRPAGAVRVSLGIANSAGDIHRLVQFLRTFIQ